MANISTQKILSQVNPPRVQITYDVQVGNAERTVTLPMVVGVMGDFSGNPATPLPPMKERDFVEINANNFNQVMEGMGARLTLQVKNTLQPDADDLMGVELEFTSVDDFDPDNVIAQIPALNQLFEARNRLSDLLSQIDGNQQLDALLNQVLTTPAMLEDLRNQLGTSDGPAAPHAPSSGSDPKPKQK